MSTPDTPKPRLDPYWEQRFEAFSLAFLGLADRVEELEARLDKLEKNISLLAEAVIQLDSTDEDEPSA